MVKTFVYIVDQIVKINFLQFKITFVKNVLIIVNFVNQDQ